METRVCLLGVIEFDCVLKLGSWKGSIEHLFIQAF